jgi:hypothetical protein
MTDAQEVDAAALTIRDAAFQYLQDEHGVRVEDYLTVLAAVTGEAALVSTGIDIEEVEIAPGSGMFGGRVNDMLSGDSAELAEAGPSTVIGVLRERLVPGLVPADWIDLQRLYTFVASNVGRAPWGAVTLSVPEDNYPRVLPIRAAFEMRPVVDAACEGLPGAGDPVAAVARHVPCAAALASALEQTSGAIDLGIGVALALEVTFSMAKMMPMSRRAMESIAAEGPPAAE